MEALTEKLLKNLLIELEKEVRVFEEIETKFRDDLFYMDYSYTAYVFKLNASAQIKEALFRMDINKEELSK
tara:strand:- start:607 stop:819 length:213 start_codon:yes stop_codon:yes gene_type:complete